jgi:hypothetical protein
MTREQIIAKWDAISPRERDAWVAEVVFDRPNVRPYRGRFVFDNVGYIGGKPIGDVMGVVDVDDYTTDISAAWTVFEITLDPNRTALWPLGNGVSGLFYAVAYDDVIVAHGKTASEAICLAALIAKITEEDEQ